MFAGGDPGAELPASEGSADTVLACTAGFRLLGKVVQASACGFIRSGAPVQKTVDRAVLLLACAGVAWIVALQTFATRGHVVGDADQPVAGADVWLAEGNRVVARTRTDETGYFRFLHRPITRGEHSLLICARGYGAIVSSPATTAIVDSRYGINPLTPEGAFWSPHRQKWRAQTPPTCPREIIPAGRTTEETPPTDTCPKRAVSIGWMNERVRLPAPDA